MIFDACQRVVFCLKMQLACAERRGKAMKPISGLVQLDLPP